MRQRCVEVTLRMWFEDSTEPDLSPDAELIADNLADTADLMLDKWMDPGINRTENTAIWYKEVEVERSRDDFEV